MRAARSLLVGGLMKMDEVQFTAPGRLDRRAGWARLTQELSSLVTNGVGLDGTCHNHLDAYCSKWPLPILKS
jgi:hypothetical protein